jgi:hypothetical protein
MDGDSAFEQKYRGLLYNILGWDQLTAFWRSLDPAAGWYLYAVGQALPERPATAEEVGRFIRKIDVLLRTEHDEKYCGIVYADDLGKPGFIKIYDPGNLGVSCGSSGQHVFPGWVMSLQPPVELMPKVVPGNRKRWWQSLVGD